MKRLIKRIISLAVSLLLFLGLTGALAEPAASEWGIIDTMLYRLGSDAAKKADQVLQRDLYTGTVNGMAFTVSEAGYDGQCLFLRCCYRIPEAKNAFGVKAEEIYGEFLPEGVKPGSFVEGLTDEGSELSEARQIGWWYDQFWIDGKGMNLAVGAMQSLSGSDIPGEIIETDYLPLYKNGVFLEGKVRISLPIGTRSDLSEYDAEGFLILPEDNVVTFELDTRDILSRVRTSQPEQGTELSGFTAKVSRAAFTPLQTYITVETALKPGALEAFIAENGEGETNEEGELMFRYGPIDVVTPWLESLTLVDGNGTALFPNTPGLEEHDEQKAEFQYPYLENLPESLFLAPYDLDTGKADMTSAIPVI